MNAIRSIPIPSEIVDALREHIGGRTEGFVFTTKDGSQWNVDLVLKENRREALKVTRGRLHMFRHRFATRQLHARVPVVVISKILGHGGISSTFNVSARVLAEHVEQFERQDARILGTYRAADEVRLQKKRESRTIYDAGWSSLVARRAHNPEVVGSNPTPATNRARTPRRWRAR